MAISAVAPGATLAAARCLSKAVCPARQLALPGTPVLKPSLACLMCTAPQRHSEALPAPGRDASGNQPFVNLGERYWHIQRRRWLTTDRTSRAQRKRRLKAVAVDLTRFEALFRTPDRKVTLPQAMPLGQMVDILVELWEDSSKLH
ncbi:unnamed protein product [Symbiodinium sp. KB8]|nr:unnamed protein product [Symbiodinium sp. KB8]